MVTKDIPQGLIVGPILLNFIINLQPWNLRWSILQQFCGQYQIGAVVDTHNEGKAQGPWQTGEMGWQEAHEAQQTQMQTLPCT